MWCLHAAYLTIPFMLLIGLSCLDSITSLVRKYVFKLSAGFDFGEKLKIRFFIIIQ